MIKFRHTTLILDMVFFVIQFVTLTLTILSKRYYFAGDVLLTTFLFAVYIFFEAKNNWHLHYYLRSLVILSIINHNLMGEYLNFYQTSPFFDRAAHFLGMYAFTLFAYFIIGQFTRQPVASKTREFIFVVALGIALGALFEIVEFFTDTVLRPPVKYQPSLSDTDFDIISNTFGAIMAALHVVSARIKSK